MGLGLACLQLTGCGESTGAPGGPAPAARSYEIVTVTRPESVEKQLAIDRARHDACVMAAESRNLPVKPFPAVPQQYFYERSTYISDGKAFLARSELYGLDDTALVPEKGCSARFAVQSSTDIQRGGKVRHIGVALDGERQVDDDAGSVPMAPDVSAASGYSVAKSIGGHAVRCLPPGSPAYAGGTVREMCIADAGAIDANGKPVIVAATMKNATGTTMLVTVPQTLRLGERIDAKAFDDAGAL
jgi:hypothetical protein